MCVCFDMGFKQLRFLVKSCLGIGCSVVGLYKVFEGSWCVVSRIVVWLCDFSLSLVLWQASPLNVAETVWVLEPLD